MNKGDNIEKILKNLPDKFIVRVAGAKEGPFVADILELGVFTEVDELSELDFAINDLIATYYDIPASYIDKFRYVQAGRLSPRTKPKKQYEFDFFQSRALQHVR